MNSKEHYLVELKLMLGEVRVDSAAIVFPDGLINRIWDDAYYSGLAKAAQIALAHKGSAEKKRRKGRPLTMCYDTQWVEIQAEERGEDIASELIHKAITDEMKGLVK